MKIKAVFSVTRSGYSELNTNCKTSNRVGVSKITFLVKKKLHLGAKIFKNKTNYGAQSFDKQDHYLFITQKTIGHL